MIERIKLVLAAQLLGAATCSAAELTKEAPVIRTEPITAPRPAPECRGGRPHTGDLLEVLRWDLCMGEYTVPAAEPAIRGYRVYYEWDDRVFTRVMREPPGQVIPIRVSVE